MGLFDWLTGSITPAPEDRIWLTKDVKYREMKRQVQQSLADSDQYNLVIVLAHFPECLYELEAVLADEREDERLYLLLSEDLSRWSQRLPREDVSALILVGEKHPLPDPDARILEFFKTISERGRVIYHLSLEDAVIRRFTSEKMTAILRQLGMKEEESLQTSMVSKQIRKAQAKLSRKTIGDSRAKSAEEWLTLNCP